MRKILMLALLCPYFSYCQPIALTGTIINEEMDPVAGATVVLKRTGVTVLSDDKGEFRIAEVKTGDTLQITAVGYATAMETVKGFYRERMTFVLRKQTSTLDDVVVIAYGSTSKRYNTGSVSRITSDEISRQPVPNAISMLQGFIPGLEVTQANGRPGANFTVTIRGLNSLKQGVQPLFIVDGIPFMLNGGSLSQQSPLIHSIFNTINPSDIESIEVLKDADATAIYGSQGANGVVLITTKKGKAGAGVSLSYYTGFGRPTRSVKLLETAPYLAMRREAFANDGVVPNQTTAPDLLLWDSTSHTDWQEALTGATARSQNYQASLSGASGSLSYMFSGNHFRETTVFPMSAPALRSSGRIYVNHQPAASRFRAQFSVSYGVDQKDQPFGDLTSFILLPPNAPPAQDAQGKLLWTPGLENPYSQLKINYQSFTRNLMANTGLGFKVRDDLSIQLNSGYNLLMLDEEKQTPIESLRPSATATGALQLSAGALRSWLIEPQLIYRKDLSRTRLEVLAGVSVQQRIQVSKNISGTGFTNDDLIGSIGAAAMINASNTMSAYKYAAVFGRVHVNRDGRYILNLNLRRDGSSRFGPDKRFASFGAVGGAWIFSEESWFKNLMPFISFGKMRGSYGVTGNDQIGDYQYYDAWSSALNYQYNGTAGILPNRLYNADLQWERTQKLEAAIDIGLLNDRLLLSASWYRNRSSNQLVNYKIPAQTGFTTLLKNLDAVIQNTGMETELSFRAVETTQFGWQVSCNVSIPKNKLLRYPDLENSSDRLSYAIGQPLQINRNYVWMGVDDATGVHSFVDADNSGRISSPGDLVNISFLGVRYFGGLQNTFRFKNWQMNLAFYGVRQDGRNYLLNLTQRPGMMVNQPEVVLQRWQKPGDMRAIQKFSASAASPTNGAYNIFRNSSAAISDASFIRLRNASISYMLTEKQLSSIKIKGIKVFVEGQNLLTFTNYEGADPETQSVLSLPPMRVVAAGFQITF